MIEFWLAAVGSSQGYICLGGSGAGETSVMEPVKVCCYPEMTMLGSRKAITFMPRCMDAMARHHVGSGANTCDLIVWRQHLRGA